ncbi:MAG: DUF2842 domain-containing protein [Rhizomicrobium sp.]
MTPRLKKLIGTILILLWVPFYMFFVAGLAALALRHANGVESFLFFAIAGTLWAVPVGLMFPWMFREPKSKA